MTFLERETNTVPGVTYSHYETDLPNPIAWSPNGASFVSYLDQFELACWDAFGGKTTHVMPRSAEVREKGFAVMANWSANSQTVAYADTGAEYVRLADCKAGQDRDTLPAQGSSVGKPAIIGLAWSPDGRTLATYTVAGLKLWQKNGLIVDFIPEQAGSVSSAYNQQAQVELTWSPNGQLIATSESFGSSGVTKVWDLLFGGPPQMLITTGAAQVLWSEDSSELQVVFNNSVTTWRVDRVG
jgi:WD40 repeat protein